MEHPLILGGEMETLSIIYTILTNYYIKYQFCVNTVTFCAYFFIQIRTGTFPLPLLEQHINYSTAVVIQALIYHISLFQESGIDLNT